MAQNPLGLRVQIVPSTSTSSSGGEQGDGADTHTRFPVQAPGPEEFARLQELLAQALKREAEAHKKMRHIHDQLTEVHPSQSRTLSNGSPILWDSELSQTSDASVQSPTPALIVVSGSPVFSRKCSMPNAPTSSNKQHQNNELPHGSNQLGPSLRTSNDISTNSTPNHGQDLTESPGKGLEPSSSPPPTLGHLAPSIQDFRGVIQEREKPPTSLPKNSPEGETPHPSSIPTHLTNASKNSTSVSSADNGLTQSLDLSIRASTLPSHAISRSMSIKEKHRSKGMNGFRGRSGTTHFIPNWIRRRRSQPSRSLQSSPVDSFDEIFERFVQSTTTTIQQDSLAAFIDHHWSEVCNDSAPSPDVRQYRDAVWDLFQAETKFLTRFLQPLEQVYKGFLEELHFHGILKIADVDKIFANLSELCELSASVANDLFKLFEGRSAGHIASNNELILAFSMFGHKFNPVYQRFCVNFEKQRGLVRALGQLPDFQEYLRVCRTHQLVGKNDLSALLIAPMQHQCRYQLMLEKVLKYTKNKSEKELLSSAIKAFVVSLKELEAKIDENKRSAELLELQETLHWPTLSQIDPSAYIPESVMSGLSGQACASGDLLASKDRQLVYHSPLKLMDSKLKPPKEVVVFLFTDLLLLTQQNSTQVEKKNPKKESMNQLARYSVLSHPIFLNLLDVYDVPFHSAHGYLITLIERNAFHQRVGAYSLQMTSKAEKAKWMSQLTQTKNILWHKASPDYIESDV